MKKKRRFGVNVGTSSIMLIFVILCLVSFATLSIVSAKVDYDLSRKLADRTTTYYNACNQCEEFLYTFDTELHQIYQSSTDEADYYNKAGEKKSFSIELSEYQTLDIQIDILYPNNPESDAFYNVISWQVITNDNLELDDNLNVFTEDDFIIF